MSRAPSPIGWMPHYNDINWEGIEDFSKEDFRQAMTVDKDEWSDELLPNLMMAGARRRDAVVERKSCIL